MDQTKILCVEDDPAVLKGLTFGLKEEGFIVYGAGSAEEGYKYLRKETPHLLLLDIRLPGENGFDFCKRIRSEGFSLPVLMLTARDEEVDKVLGLEIGADDYVIKPYSLRELVSRVRALIRRSYGELSTVSEKNSSIRFGNIEIDTKRLRVFKDEQEVLLTPIEFKLLKYLAEHPDQYLNREQILNAVWGAGEYYGDDRTIDVHIRHLREKLEADPSNPVFFRTIRGFGYMFVKKS